MAKKRTLDKVKLAMPCTPEKKARIVIELSRSSPRTQNILVVQGHMRSPEEEKEFEALKAVAGDLKEGLGVLKTKRSNSDRSAFSAAKSLAFGKRTKSKKAQKTLAKIISIDRKSVRKAINKRNKILRGDEPSWLATKRKTRHDALSDEVKRRVYDFWTHSVSHPTGNKSDILRKFTAPKVYIEHPKHVLEMTQTEAFLMFQKENEDVKIRQRKFESLKPFFVQSARERDRQSCMCRQHVEIKMVFGDVMKFRRSLVEKEGVAAILYSSVSEVVEQTLCPKPENQEFHRTKCLQRYCGECGAEKFEVLPEEKSTESRFKWKRYDYMPTGKVGKDGSEIKKITLVNKETSPSELFSYFIELLEKFLYHTFLAKWQRKQCDSLIENIPIDSAICVHDYSENYGCRAQNELQSQYFSMEKVSIHVTVLYRHATEGYDKVTSSASNPQIVKEYLFAISDDEKQDHDSVLHIQKLISDYLCDTVKVSITQMHEFTDGCAGQYKSRHCVGDLSCSRANLGYTVLRNYFATSHAKGEQDAAGSHVKQKATAAVLRQNTTICSARDLCDFLATSFSQPASTSFSSRQSSVNLERRVYFYIPTSGSQAVPRNRPEGQFRSLKGIRQLHSIRTCNEQLKVYVRERTCYCFECLHECYDKCNNREWVDEWEEIQLQRESAVSRTRSTADAGSIDHSETIADLTTKDSVVAIAAADDAQYDYYLLKVVSDGVVALEDDFCDDYGSVFSRTQKVLLGNFFLRENIIDFTFRLEEKKLAAVYPATVRYLCSDLLLKSKPTKKKKAVYKMPLTEHEEIMASL